MRAKSGPEAARFTELYREHYWLVLRYLRRRADESVADDLAGDVFLVAWRRLDDVPAITPLPWLYKTAGMLLSNERRAGDRKARLLHRVGTQTSDVSVDEDVLESLWVREALDQLSESDQEILRLSAWEDLSGADIAAVLNCSNNAAAVRLHRARARLRQVLEQDLVLTESTAKEG